MTTTHSVHSKNIFLLIMVGLPIFIGALDLTVVSAVLPHVIYDLEIPFQSGLDDAAWIVTGYLLAYTIAMTFMGRLSDLTGRRFAFLAALLLFALGSYLVAVADRWPTDWLYRMGIFFGERGIDRSYLALWAMVAARMVQAFGAGAMVPVGMALVGDIYPPETRARPLGFIAAVDTAGWVVGHLYGGIVTRYFDWRLIFWLNLPVCLIVFITIYRTLAGLTIHKAPKMDWIGALIVAVALTMLNIGLGIAETASPNYQNTRWPFLILSVVLLAIYFVWTTKNTTPLLPIHLFQSRNFSIGAALNFMIGIALFIGIANVPLFINTLVATSLEDGAWDSGWLLSGLTVPMAIASIPGGWLTTRVGGRWPVRAGLVIAFAGYLLCTGWQANTSYIQIVSHLALAGIGFGLCMAPAATMMLNESGENERGAASALVMISRLTGMTIGTSAMTTYGIQRMNALSLQFQPTGTNIQNTVMVGMQIAEQVISETFLVAAIICVVAIVPINFSIPSR